MNDKKGSLTIVGTGINALAQITVEAKAYIECAEKVLMHVPEAAAMAWIRELNSNVEDLQPCYHETENRAEAYERMIQAQVEAVQAGLRTVSVFYGHPGIFVYPSHEAIRRLLLEGFQAKMLPGVSAEDCLFADIGIDPARSGCVQHEATAFLFRSGQIDSSVGLILWQIGTLGDISFNRLNPSINALAALRDKLSKYYPASHRLAIYEAPVTPVGQPRIDWLTLEDLTAGRYTPASTLFIPPCRNAELDLDSVIASGLTEAQVTKVVSIANSL